MLYIFEGHSAEVTEFIERLINTAHTHGNTVLKENEDTVIFLDLKLYLTDLENFGWRILAISSLLRCQVTTAFTDFK